MVTILHGKCVCVCVYVWSPYQLAILNLTISVPKIYLKFLNGVKAMPARVDGRQVTQSFVTDLPWSPNSNKMVLPEKQCAREILPHIGEISEKKTSLLCERLHDQLHVHLEWIFHSDYSK